MLSVCPIVRPVLSTTYDHERTDRRRSGRNTTTRAQWLVLAAAFLGWMFDGVEMGIFPLVARPALQSMMPLSALGQDQFVGLWMGRITALFLVGAAVGGLGFGWLGDRVGRVRAMTLSILTYSIFTGLCYFAQEPWHLGALRFIAAFGMGGEWSLGVALVMEAWPSDKRALLAGIIGIASNAGYLADRGRGALFPRHQGFLALDHDRRSHARSVGAGHSVGRAGIRTLESRRAATRRAPRPGNPVLRVAA